VVAGTSLDAATDATEELAETAKLFLILRGSKIAAPQYDQLNLFAGRKSSP
jgi:hypothetical protein